MASASSPPSLLYCPKCGARLQMRQGAWVCVPGHMVLGRTLGERLLDVYVRQTAESPATKPSQPFGGHWHCPGCARSLEETPQGLYCQGCGQALDRFVAMLNKAHPHG